MKIVKPEVSLEHPIHGEEILERIERAGRTCYKSEDKIDEGSARKFVRMILKSGHHSVIEHVSISLRFICDRGVTHEMVRHRIASYSQESTRYCNYAKAEEIQVIEPSGLDISLHNKWRRAMEESERQYLLMIDDGASPQIARSVLPNSLKTEIVMTANLREWSWFFKLRCSQKAHPQMREVALEALRLLSNAIPVVFDDLKKEHLDKML